MAIWIIRQILGLAGKIPAANRHPVLIVENDRHDAALIAMYCERFGAKWVKAETLQEARMLLGKQSFRLMFVDEGMPDGSGVKFIDEITPNYPHLPVSILTGDTEISSRLWAGRNWSIILKGTHGGALMGAVENAILTANGVNGHSQPVAVLISSWLFFTLTFLAGLFCRELPDAVRWLANQLKGAL